MLLKTKTKRSKNKKKSVELTMTFVVLPGSSDRFREGLEGHFVSIVTSSVRPSSFEEFYFILCRFFKGLERLERLVQIK